MEEIKIFTSLRVFHQTKNSPFVLISILNQALIANQGNRKKRRWANISQSWLKKLSEQWNACKSKISLAEHDMCGLHGLPKNTKHNKVLSCAHNATILLGKKVNRSQNMFLSPHFLSFSILVFFFYFFWVVLRSFIFKYCRWTSHRDRCPVDKWFIVKLKLMSMWNECGNF